MSLKNLLIGISSALLLVGMVAGGALAGEGDYPPLDTTTGYAKISSQGKEAANCGKAGARENLTVEECLSICK